MLTFLQLKQGMRARVFPAGEAKNLRAAHDKSVVDALVDVQRWVECLQSNNTFLIPHCNTNYNCGLTSFNFPRALIHKLSVIDKINPETGLEDATAADDWCSEVTYEQVDACHIKSYLGRSAQCGSCWPLNLFFALPQALLGGKSGFPVPTDEGVAAGLPSLPLGYHYPQLSTNAARRAMAGVWAIEGSRIFVAPWIQSTETIVIRYAGLKRDWVDSDIVDDDPELLRAVDNYVRWEHFRDWGNDPGKAQTAEMAYKVALSQLIYDCNEETRVRGCEPFMARGLAPTLKLYYNDQPQQGSATCPAGTTGTPNSITVTIPRETVGSTVSVTDANRLALDQARQQARDQLVCTESGTVYWNTPQSSTATCGAGGTGNPSTVTIEAGEYSSTVSQADANAQALAAAAAAAAAELVCTYANTEQEYEAVCPSGTVGDSVTKTTAAANPLYNSTISQADADEKALAAAKLAAESELVCDGVPAAFVNVVRIASVQKTCARRLQGGGGSSGGSGNQFTICSFYVTVTVPANRFSSVNSQTEANTNAYNAGLNYANFLALQRCGQLSGPNGWTVPCADINAFLP